MRKGGEGDRLIFELLILLLEDLSNACGKERPLQVARELTKLHEEFIGPTIESAIEHFNQNNPRGEFTIVLGGDTSTEVPKENEQSELLDKMKNLIQEYLATHRRMHHLD